MRIGPAAVCSVVDNGRLIRLVGVYNWPLRGTVAVEFCYSIMMSQVGAGRKTILYETKHLKRCDSL